MFGTEKRKNNRFANLSFPHYIGEADFVNEFHKVENGAISDSRRCSIFFGNILQKVNFSWNKIVTAKNL